MREIKFRGKKNINSPFIYGNCIQQDKTNNTYYLAQKADGMFPMQWTEVDESTINQYTGSKDKNGVEIYEGDIVKLKSWEGLHSVAFKDGGFVLDNGDTFLINMCYIYDDEETQATVVGNIYDNTELIKKEK